MPWCSSGFTQGRPIALEETSMIDALPLSRGDPWLTVEIVDGNLQVSCDADAQSAIPAQALQQIAALLAAWTWPDVVEAKVPSLTDKSFWRVWVQSEHLDALPEIVTDFERYARRWERSKYTPEDWEFERRGLAGWPGRPRLWRVQDVLQDWAHSLSPHAWAWSLDWFHFRLRLLTEAGFYGDRGWEADDSEPWQPDAFAALCYNSVPDETAPRRRGRPTQASGRGIGRGYGQGGKRVAGTKLDRLAAERRRHSGETGADDW
jgi:hypothetical protein